MFEEASEVFDNMFKASFPLTFIVFIPAVLILVSPLPAEAAHEFTVYRMQQYDLQGQAYGEKYIFLVNNSTCTYVYITRIRGVLILQSVVCCRLQFMWNRLQ